jgi:hypothetical protein
MGSIDGARGRVNLRDCTADQGQVDPLSRPRSDLELSTARFRVRAAATRSSSKLPIS